MTKFLALFFAMAALVATIDAAPRANKFNLKIPDECKGKGFCAIKPEGYDKMLKSITKHLKHFIIAENIGDRSSDGSLIEEYSPENDTHNCPYVKKPEWNYAYSHTNGTDDDYFIIQDDMFTQVIDIVTCTKDRLPQSTIGSQECFRDLGLNKFEKKTICKTIEANHSLVVYDLKTDKLKLKAFPRPCCCVCDIE